jgi:pimeloyl-ACP methyl ester carboxylesterase
MRTHPLRSFLAVVCIGASAACESPDHLMPLATIASSDASTASASRSASSPSIVLVHGAFADATGWQDLIPILQRRGYSVIAVQNQLTSVDADIATTRRVIEAQPGDVVVVGHSYGGVSISGAASGIAKVKALVYVAAYAPDAGESVSSLNAMFPPTPLVNAIVPDVAGFAYIDAAKYAEVFAQDVPPSKTRVMAVTQKPASFATLGLPLGVTPAWQSIPSWYIVAQNDRTINPDLERFLAKRMGATTTELSTSHVPFISRPEQVAKVIFAAIERVAP